jgi:transposase
MTLKARELLVRQKTQLVNAIRGHMAEMGIVAAAGPRRLACPMIAMPVCRQRHGRRCAC